MGSIKRDAEGRFTLKEVRDQLDKNNYRAVSFSQFDIQALQIMPLKALKLNDIVVSLPDLKIIQPMTILESLSLKSELQTAAIVFPLKLKALQIIPSHKTAFLD
jgi:hypothetical protein